jgi:hypothetical protein
MTPEWRRCELEERGHIEFIQEQEMEWTSHEYSDEVPAVERKNLSTDARTGAFTDLVRLHEGWELDGPRSFPHTQELFVLEGEVTVDSHDLDERCYVRLPEDVKFDGIRARSDARVLWMSEGDLAGEGEEGHFIWEEPEDSVYVQDAKEMEWTEASIELQIKTLWTDEENGAHIHLLYADEGWEEPRSEHHPMVEESYKLSGDMLLGEPGIMRGGGYFWRPPWIHHGPLRSVEGTTSLIRGDQEHITYWTDEDGNPIDW